MMFRISTFLLLAAALASCQTSSPQTRDTEPESIETEAAETTSTGPADSSGDGVTGTGAAERNRSEDPPLEEPLTLEDVVVTSFDSPGEPASPEKSGGCVSHSVAREYGAQASEYRDYLAYTEAEQQGWRRLRDVVSVGFDRSSQQYEQSAISIRKVRDDRIIDTNGHHWLAMSSWTCTPPPANYYIDEDLDVFAVVPQPKCRKKRVKGCGTFPTYGCGRQSPIEWRHYVRVPPKAVQSSARSVVVRPKVCLEFEPQDGFGSPPP